MIWGYPHFRKPQCDYEFIHLFPHIFVWGSCFWFCIPPLLVLRLLVLHLSNLCQPPSFTHHLSHTSWSTTIFHTPSFTHILVTHHLSYASFSHTICHTHLCHTHLSHTPSVTHNRSQTSFTHTIFHTSLPHTICHTPSATLNLSQTSFTHHLSHTSLSHTICHTQSFTNIFVNHHLSSLSTNIFHTAALCVAGVALGDMNLRLCVAGVVGEALGDIHLRFAWEACHLATSTFLLRGRHGTYSTGLALAGGTLCGRRGTWWHPPSFRVAGVALGHIHLRFAWQAWHLWHWAGSGGARGPVLVAGDAAALCVAGVALGDIHLRFAWQAWHLVTSTFVLRGRRGTYGAGLALVARLGRSWSPVTPRHFAWQAWHLVTSTFLSRGRRGAWSHPPSFCVAGVALMALGWLRWRAWAGFVRKWRWRRGTLRGRHGTWWHPPSFCVAGVALGHIHLRLCVAGVALMALGWLWWSVWARFWSPVTLRHFAWQAWHLETCTFVLRGRRGTYGTGLALVSHALSLSHTIFVTQHLSHTIFHRHPLSHPTLSHTIFHTHHLSHTIFHHTIFHTHNFFTHHIVTHHLSHTIFHLPFCHTPLCHTPSFTHHLSLCHTPSFTHNYLSHTIFHQTIFHTQHLSHTIFRHAIFHTPLFHTPYFTHNLVTRSLSHTTFTHTHTPPFTDNFVTHTHHLSFSHTIFHIHFSHTQLCFTSGSSTTSFVFPSFPVPATTFGAHYWKKLPCGVIRSFNFFLVIWGTASSIFSWKGWPEGTPCIRIRYVWNNM